MLVVKGSSFCIDYDFDILKVFHVVKCTDFITSLKFLTMQLNV